MVIDIVYGSSNSIGRKDEKGLITSVKEQELEAALIPYQDGKPS